MRLKLSDIIPPILILLTFVAGYFYGEAKSASGYRLGYAHALEAVKPTIMPWMEPVSAERQAELVRAAWAEARLNQLNGTAPTTRILKVTP